MEASPHASDGKAASPSTGKSNQSHTLPESILATWPTPDGQAFQKTAHL
jgi:hypothetical protein